MKSFVGKKILVVDDEKLLRDVLRDELEFLKATVEEAPNGRVAFDLSQKDKFDAIVSDVRMPEGDGIELLKRIRAIGKTPILLLITGYSDVSPEEALAIGADAILSKPFDLTDLTDRLLSLL